MQVRLCISLVVVRELELLTRRSVTRRSIRTYKLAVELPVCVG